MSVVALVARQRSGTGALGSILNQHPEVRYCGEIFHNNHSKAHNFFNFVAAEVKKENFDFLLPGNADYKFEKYIEHLHSCFQDRVKVVDIKYNSFHHLNECWHGLTEAPNLIKLLKKHNIPIIHLTRRNTLKTYVSSQLAHKNSAWHTSVQSKAKVKTVELDPVLTLRWLNHTQLEISRMNSLLSNYPQVLEIEYQELFDEEGYLDSKVGSTIASILDVQDFKRTKPLIIKQAKSHLSSSILNLDEIKNKLTGTDFNWMLDD
ncbi:sulfotransferase putative [Vibrio variabilis]|uniref:Sulfotransferase putative n=1 Tax=Vibrio variabilis TaxID=990271 RepID=A0ABQ0J602_9VIBR|nr:sulfotransferase putative [Vibrio variabilis]